MDEGDTISLSFPFVRYHLNFPKNIRNYKERIKIEKYGPSPLKGIEILTKVEELEPLDETSFSSDTEPLNEKTEELIVEFIKFCKSKDIELLFVKYPSRLTYDEDFHANMRQNSVLEIAKKEGCTVLDLERNFNDIGLNEATDFYNRGHTNHRGQVKITEYLGSFIQNNMDIRPTELNQTCRDDWNKAAEYYAVMCEMSEKMIQAGDAYFLADHPNTMERIERFMKKRDSH